MKQLAILGSTGSIGRNALQIVERFPDRFGIKALAAKNNTALLARQVEQFNPEIAVVYDDVRALELKKMLRSSAGVEIMYGEDGYCSAASHNSVQMVLSAVVGSAGLMPTIAAIEAGKTIALANKETLVMAGEIVMQNAAARRVRILPIDSEHSAIFQCLAGNRSEDLGKILLTASGGPFLNRPIEEFADITPESALRHPNWQMGPKITVDSATLMNKGLEVIEAKWLFGVTLAQIEVFVHPQSIVHSMIAFRDGSVMAQMGVPDMKGAIAYALSFPARLPLAQPVPDLTSGMALTFQKPDVEKFPCLSLAFRAGAKGGTLPAVMNAANEVAVQAFLNGHLAFTGIPQIIRAVMDMHVVIDKPDLAALLEADRWARAVAEERIDVL
jgi:1-deoxy-D-xylulose-5-phosphate reductoisomerase